MKNFGKEAMADLKAGASKGGAAARGEKKRRSMKGIKPGGKSAGRANAATQAEAPKPEVVAYFADVKRACTEWLRGRGIKVGSFREMMLADIHEAKKCQVRSEQ